MALKPSHALNRWLPKAGFRMTPNGDRRRAFRFRRHKEETSHFSFVLLSSDSLRVTSVPEDLWVDSYRLFHFRLYRTLRAAAFIMEPTSPSFWGWFCRGVGLQVIPEHWPSLYRHAVAHRHRISSFQVWSYS